MEKAFPPGFFVPFFAKIMSDKGSSGKAGENYRSKSNKKGRLNSRRPF